MCVSGQRTAVGLWKSVDELHTAYEDGAKKHKNQLPLCGITEIIASKARRRRFGPTSKSSSGSRVRATCSGDTKNRPERVNAFSGPLRRER